MLLVETVHDPKTLALALDLLAQVHLELEDVPFSDIDATIGRALALKADAFTVTSPQYGETLLLRGRLFKSTGNENAGRTLEEVRVLCALTSKSSCEVGALRQLARIASEKADFPAANRLGEEAVQQSEQLSGPDSMLTGIALAELGVSNLGPNIQKARAELDRAVRILRSHQLPDHPFLAFALSNQGSVDRLTGDFEGARPLFEEGLRIYETVFGPEHRLLIAVSNNLGLDLKQMGEYRAARPYLERANRLAEKRYGPNGSVTAATLLNLGIVVGEQGDTVAAQAIYEHALTIQEKNLGPNHPLVAANLNSLGLLLEQTGDYMAARRDVERALTILLAKDGEKGPKTLEVMTNLASIEDDMGDHKAALETATRAAALSAEYVGKESSAASGAWLTQATALMGLKRFTEAHDLFTLVADMREKDDPRGTDLIEARGGLAESALALSHFEESREETRKLLAVILAVFGPDHPDMWKGWKTLAQAELGMKHFPEALDAALESERVRRKAQMSLAAGVTERRALLSAFSTSSSLDLVVSLADPLRRNTDAIERIWDSLIRSRALVLDTVAHRAQLARSEVSAAELERFTQARQDLSWAIQRGAGSKGPAAFAARLGRLNEAAEKAEGDLARVNAPFRISQEQQRATLAQVREALPAFTALAAFIRYADPRGDRYMAFVQTDRHSAPVAVPLGPAATIDALVARWREEIRREMNSEGRGQTSNLEKETAAGLALRRAVWDPLTACWRGARRLDLVPDSTLQMVNFSALPAGEGRFVVESGPMIQLLSTERDIMLPATRSGEGLLAVGNPSFNTAIPAVANRNVLRGANQSCSDLDTLQFAPLPGSAGEARAVARIWRGEGGTAHLLIGNEASLAAFRDNASGKQVLHLATHGFFIESACSKNSTLDDNPLLRAGVAFSGANRHESAMQKGVITASEVAAMDLGGTDWVVLSACDTGSGKIVAGEGVLGLRRAFQIAGARTVIGSLWPVEDQETRLWMISLYRAHFLRGMDTAQSVRQAELDRLRDRRAKGLSVHPFYWGGFVAVGDWR